MSLLVSLVWCPTRCATTRPGAPQESSNARTSGFLADTSLFTTCRQRGGPVSPLGGQVHRFGQVIPQMSSTSGSGGGRPLPAPARGFPPGEKAPRGYGTPPPPHAPSPPQRFAGAPP